jgi:alanine dehydrogenase
MPASPRRARAAGRGAEVALLTRSRRSCDTVRAQGIHAEVADGEAVERHAVAADLVVGAVFAAGEPTPKLLPRALVARMKRGAVIVDICIEEGGVAETSRRTSLADPTYVEEGVVHYCVGNMPSARPAEGRRRDLRGGAPLRARHGAGGAWRRRCSPIPSCAPACSCGRDA